MKKSKKYFVFWERCIREKAKMPWRHVCLTCVILLMLPFVGKAQQQKVTVRVNKADVQEVFRQIKEQTGLNFVYDKEQMTAFPPVTLTMEGGTVDAVLKRVFAGSLFEYTYEGSSVVVRKRVTVAPKTDGVVIRGVVSDQDGNTLPGVSVVLKGATLGTASDADGKFALALPSLDGVVLTFTCIGMKTREIAVKDARALNVTLEEDSETIQEVVVTGIYTRNKESFTGSFATYSKEDLKMIGSQNVIQSLKSLDPSMLVLESKQWGSDPNRMPDIEIRGKTSVVGLKTEFDNDPNQPLFILDGIETTLETIVNLNMDRVASVTILKDAASTAIYGSKAANGVIVVETVQPEAGKLRLSYSGNYGIQFADLSAYNLMNASEKLEFERLTGLYEDGNDNARSVLP